MSISSTIDTAPSGDQDRAVQQSAAIPHPLVERIVASEDRMAQAAAEVHLLDVGQVCRQRAYPHVFDANVVRRPRLDPDTVDDAIRRLQTPLRAIGARHLQIACDGAPVSDGLAEALAARGFVRDRLLAMVLAGPIQREPLPEVSVLAVGSEAPRRWYADTMDRMSREEPWYTPAVAREIVGSLESKAQAGVLSLYVAAVGGRPVGAIGLSIGEGATEGVAAIVTVGTIPEARGRGVAQTMVAKLAAKARAAGCDLVYLVARASDTPRDMYRKFGFGVAFGFDVWLRPPV